MGFPVGTLIHNIWLASVEPEARARAMIAIAHICWRLKDSCKDVNRLPILCRIVLNSSALQVRS